MKIEEQVSERTSVASLARINLTYLARHGRLPNLAAPKTFTELVQWRKLHDRNSLFPILADKLAVKDIVTDRLGREWVTPTLWSGTELPENRRWPHPLVVKSRHGCNQIVFVKSGKEDWAKIRRDAVVWAKKTYGFWLDEWVYKHIPRGILIEPFIGYRGVVPVDYKFYTFNGQVVFIQVHLDREHDHRWMLFDRNWRRVSAVTQDDDPPAPRSLNDMIEAAENLGKNIDFVRVDLYEPEGLPVFGEMTFYPGSGLDPFDPVSLDKLIGAEWLKAIAAMTNESAQSSNRTPSDYGEQPEAALA
ncbi:ATP-grasp fold amidoligase family protein [Parasphingorhabdus sp.]|uniref:ATP-grasp fold amidoligase family protein n=1 Tax=Parasphingorhabdus sp. TaxID=2709688 RepID=UPI003C78689D